MVSEYLQKSLIQPIHTINLTVNVVYRYPVYFTNSLFALENPLLKGVLATDAMELSNRMLCIVDRGVYAHHPALLDSIRAYCQYNRSAVSLVCPPLLFDGGEDAKNRPKNLALIQRAIYRYGICRRSSVMVVGGGAVLDMAGYAAATSHRGIRLIRVPTTVLSQSDSGVGVKNGVNAFGRKNFLGTFAPPAAVLNDWNFLTTLSMRDWRSGISEAVKVALLKDADFFNFIEKQADELTRRNIEAMRRLIHRCSQWHLNHIATSGDPFEFGSSRPLDFGHWAAHKLEQLSHYAIRHGEAVAVGIALDSTYSHLTGLLAKNDWERILGLLSTLGFNLYPRELGLSRSGQSGGRFILDGLEEFREHLGGRLTITLLERIGKSHEVHSMDKETVLESIAILKDYELNLRELKNK